MFIFRKFKKIKVVIINDKFNRMRAILYVNYFEKNYTMYPMKDVQAVLLISAGIELCLRI